jgi:hypothetical protein
VTARKKPDESTPVWDGNERRSVSIADEAIGEAALTELRQSNARLQQQLRRAKAKVDDLAAAVYQAAKDAALTQPPARPLRIPKFDKRNASAEVALIHSTDWQTGKETADYNSEVAYQRIGVQLMEKVLHITDLQRSHHPVRECHLLLGGDMVEGTTIFATQAFEVDSTLYEQLFHVVHIIELQVRTLLENFDTVVVTTEFGNHGRIGRYGETPAADNIDLIAYRIAADKFADEPRVTWNISTNWYNRVEIGAYRAMLIHGDEVKGGFGGTPLFALSRKATQWASGVVEPFDGIYVGHFHHSNSLQLGNGSFLYMTGSPESGSEFARVAVGASNAPSQRLHFIDPDGGNVTAEYIIRLT